MNYLVMIRKMVYLALGLFDFILGKRNKVFILCYHSIDKGDWVHSVSAEVFRNQIEYLMPKFDFITIDKLYAYIKGRSKLNRQSIVLTFDDGYRNLVSIAGFLNSKKIKPTVFLIADVNNRNSNELGTKQPLLSRKDILDLIARGWNIGCHSMTHKDFANLNREEIINEVILSKKHLEKWLGVKVGYFAYPRGRYNSEIIKYIKKAGYKMAISMDDGVIDDNTDLFSVPKIAVNRTHDFLEFKTIYSPSVVAFRRLIKQSYFGRFI